MEEKSKVAAGLFALFFGALGVHKFYLGYTREGIITLLVTIIGGILTVGIASFVMGMIGLIEGILYLTKSDEDFKNTYVINKRPWF
ncbi:MAG: TM2 domain-containing protein [Ruminococcus sp.]|nr:TM2 domain-containing protein [Ruminococcus sp.]